VYLESGDVETAHSWLKKIPEGETNQEYERDKLLLEIYKKQGDSEKLTDLLFQKCRSYPSTDTLQALLDVLGHDKRDEVITAEVAQIMESVTLQEPNAEFLIAIGKMYEAEEHLLGRADQLKAIIIAVCSLWPKLWSQKTAILLPAITKLLKNRSFRYKVANGASGQNMR
jgi:hypothetical protein